MDSFSCKIALCRGTLATGAALTIRIRGTSMLPALWSGDSVSVHHANLADVHPGQVVVFARNGHLVTHRVVRRMSCLAVVTRGDAQRCEDSPVDAHELLGVVTALHRFGTSRAFGRKRSLLARGVARVVRRSSRVRSLLDRFNSLLVNRISAA